MTIEAMKAVMQAPVIGDIYCHALRDRTFLSVSDGMTLRELAAELSEGATRLDMQGDTQPET